MHNTSSPLAGKTVTVAPVGVLFGTDEADTYEYHVEDWWDFLTGGSWGDAHGNPAALGYAMRAGLGGLPWDDEVLYGKIGHLGYLIHVSEVVA